MKNNQTTIPDKLLLLFSILCAGYFSFLLANITYFHIEFVLFQVVQELITIPTMVASFLFFILALKQLVRKEYSKLLYIIMAIFISGGTVLWLISSFLE